MELDVTNNTDSRRIHLTDEDIKRLRPAAEKLGREKLNRILANHPPEYWENYRNAAEQHRALIRKQKMLENHP